MLKHKILKIFLAIAFVVSGLIILQWQLLISNKLMVSHDSIIWYGIFHYFADNLQHGVWSFWNPYMNCGEIFFLNINILHLSDPSTLLLILTGKLLHINLLTLYHWDLFLRYLIFICGAYFFYRHVARYEISAFLAFVAISFSSFSTSYLRQHAFLLAFYLLPWIVYSSVRFLEEQKPKFLLLTVLFLGITLPSYHSMFIISSVTILLLSLLLSKSIRWPKLGMFLKNHKAVSFLALSILFLLTIKILPIYLAYTYDVVPTVKMFEAPFAAHSFPADFLNLLTPYSFILHFFNWYYVSESFLYIGLIPLFLAIFGMGFSRHKYKWGFIITILLTMSLMLGYRSPLYLFFNKFFPFFSIIRNTHTFGPFFIFCLVYFTCIGSDVIFEAAFKSRLKFYKIPYFFLGVLICFFAWLINANTISLSNFLTLKYHILLGYLAYMNDALKATLQDSLSLSDSNLIFFVIGIPLIFILLNFKKINIKTKYTLILFFIIVDLALFNSNVYNFVTLPRITPPLLYSVKPPEENYRIPVIGPKYPFYAFVPATLKIFTAYSTKARDVTTHIYEMKDFFEFANHQQIPNEIKSILAGISAPKLRLVSNVIVLPRDKIIEALSKIDPDTARQVIFIEKNLPSAYSHLEKSPDNVNNETCGEITVKKFGPNEIILDINAERDSLLYYGDAFDKSWKVFINGKQGVIYEANLAFKSVIIDKGEHTLRFIYKPKLYVFTLFCYFLGLSIISVMLLYNYSGLKRYINEKTNQ